VAAALAALVVLSSCTSGDDSDVTSPTNQRSAQTAPVATGGGALELSVDAGEFGATMTVAITAPDDATEMQIGTDPTFISTPWQPVDNEVELSVDGGYQEVFGRFRSDEVAEPEVTVAGIDVDLALDAATAKVPTPSLIALTAPRTLSVDLQVGRIDRGVEKKEDALVGADVDPSDLDDGWALAEASGPDVAINKTDRSTRPNDAGSDGKDTTLFPVAHRITLELGAPLEIGTAYELTSPLGTTTEFTIDDTSSRSPAVHANQVGYRPADAAKVAFLSAPKGSTAIGATPGFRVIDTATGSSVLEGVATAATTAADGEYGRGDLSGVKVWRLDFSALTTPGRYRVCVDGIGCSATLAVDEDTTWLRAATTVARGLYYQRSGIALGEPYTSIDRPRPDHTDDGLVVHESKLTALEASQMGDAEIFEQLVATATTTVVEGAWGGHFDAGDWDRRAQHLFMARETFDLLRIAPDRFADLDLQIPESGNAVPDIADEALWTIDLFRRMQRPDGAIRGGVESANFPQDGATPSWDDDLARYAYAPDPWSSFIYASAAADAAVALRDIDATRSAELSTSALAAMTWAQAQPVPGEFSDRVLAQRMVAAAALLRLTGDAQWNAVFLTDNPFSDGPVDGLDCHTDELCDAAWNYLWVDSAQRDAQVVTNIRQSFTDAANAIADGADSTLFGWCLQHPEVPLVWGLGVGGTPHAMGLLRAYILSGDLRFLTAAQRCASVTLGANPLDTSYITGLGETPVRHPLIVDVNDGGLPAWAGTPAYGNHTLPGENGDQQWVIDFRLKPAGTTGDLSNLAYLQSWFDLPDVGPMNEFTVYQSHGPALWVFGVLASAAPVAPA